MRIFMTAICSISKMHTCRKRDDRHRHDPRGSHCKKVIWKDDFMILEAGNPLVENRYFTKRNTGASGADHRESRFQ